MSAGHPLYAAVDLGSNSFCIEIGRHEDGTISQQFYLKEMVRLAGGLDPEGYLTPEIQERALGTLSRFGEKLSGIDPKNIRAVGTQTLRVAKNSGEFLPRAEAALGHSIEIIAGREEARLVYSGCTMTLPPSDERRLIVDIGGASTEVIIGSGNEVESCESFHVGCVNTSVEFFPGGKITAKRLREAQLSAQAEFEEALPEFANRSWDAAYGSAGTIGAIGRIGLATGITQGTVTPELLKSLRTGLLEAGDTKKISFRSLSEERREVIAGGIAVLSAVFETFRIHEMSPAQGALRVGVLYDLLGRRNRKDLRDATVSSIIRRSSVNKQQAARVSALAVKFFSAVAGRSATQSDQKLLQWAAMLHECGRAVSPHGYHRHSQYILLNSDLPGFSLTDQARMGTLVLGQRGGLGKVAEGILDPATRRQVLALRLAVIFAHPHRTIRLPAWGLQENGKAFVLSVERSWLERHPLTEFLLEEECCRWEKAGYPLAISRFEASTTG